jgi:hypothetical protein
MQPSAQNRTSALPDSSEFIRKWLVIFAENASKEFSPALVSVWLEAFKGIERETLEAAFKETLRTWRIAALPPIGEIMSNIRAANKLALDLSSEKVWQYALDLAEDLGCDYRIERARKPEEPILLAAVRAAGGWRYISQCSEEQLVWARKTFIEIYEKHKNAPQVLLMATTPEGKKLQKQIAEIAAIKTIPQLGHAKR